MKQTINHIVIALALLLSGNLSTHAATYYGFSLGGVEVTSDNCGNIQNASGAKITIGPNLENGTEWYARYDHSTKTLTLKNTSAGNSESRHSGLVNTSCAGLTVVFIGKCCINSKDAGAELSAPTSFRSEYGMFDRNQAEIAGEKGGISVENGAKVTFSDANISVRDYAPSDNTAIWGDDGNGKEEISIWNSRVTIFGKRGISNISKLYVIESYVKIEGTAQAVNNMTTYDHDSYIKVSASEGAGAVFNPEKKTFYSAATGKAATMVKLDAFHRLTTYFEDPVFRAYVKDFDTNDDNFLTIEEAAAVTSIDVDSKDITSLDGIELFGALKELYCYNNKISKLDLTAFPNLQMLSCERNKIEELDFSKCSKLYDVRIGNNCINVENMQKLVDGLPAPALLVEHHYKAWFDVTGILNLEGYEHDNACTQAQYYTILGKGWTNVTCTDDYGITLGNIVANRELFADMTNMGSVVANSENAVAYFDPSKNELHLKDVTIYSHTEYCIRLRQNKVRIVLDGGTTSLKCTGTISPISCGLLGGLDVEICGEGKLTMSPYNTPAISNVKSLTVSGKANVLIDFVEGSTSNNAIYGIVLGDVHNLGTLTVKEEGFIRADGPNGACLKEIGTLNLEDGCTIISPAGTTFDGQNCQFIDSEGNAVTDQPLALGKMKQISRIYIDGFTWPQHNQLGDYEVSTQTEGVKSVEVQYREQDFDHTVIDPTHVFQAGEWPEIDFIIYPELGYEFISNGMEGTRVVVPTADNPTNNTYRNYFSSDGARRYFFDDYMVPTPDNSIATGIDSVANDQLHATGGTWYTLDGQQLNTKPTQKGIYLFKGKKVVVR